MKISYRSAADFTATVGNVVVISRVRGGSIRRHVP